MFRAWWFLWRAWRSLPDVGWLSREARTISPSLLSELAACGTGTTFPDWPALPGWAWPTGAGGPWLKAWGRTLPDTPPFPGWAWGPCGGVELTTAWGRTLPDTPALPGWSWASGATAGLTRAWVGTLQGVPALPRCAWATDTGALLTTAWERTVPDIPAFTVEPRRQLPGQGGQQLEVGHFRMHGYWLVEPGWLVPGQG